MEVKFLDTAIEVNTGEECMLFPWMLLHRDVKQFKLGNVYVMAEWDEPTEQGQAAVNVTIIDWNHKCHKYTKRVDNPEELSAETTKCIDIDLLDYEEYGNYSYIDSKGHLTVAQGYDRIKLKSNDGFTISDVSHNTMSIQPIVESLGIYNYKYLQYFILFYDGSNFKFFYNIQNPLDSYFERTR